MVTFGQMSTTNTSESIMNCGLTFGVCLVEVRKFLVGEVDCIHHVRRRFEDVHILEPDELKLDVNIETSQLFAVLLRPTGAASAHAENKFGQGTNRI